MSHDRTEAELRACTEILSSLAERRPGASADDRTRQELEASAAVLRAVWRAVRWGELPRSLAEAAVTRLAQSVIAALLGVPDRNYR